MSAARESRAIAAVRQARASLTRAEEALREVRRRRRVLCSCGRRHAIGDLELIVTHWYAEPHGCTGGDYWLEGEWQFACPVDGIRKRLLFNDYGVDYEHRDRVGVAAEPTFRGIYRDLFASRRDARGGDEGNRSSYNNYDVDRHRERFELPLRLPRVRRATSGARRP